MRTDLLFERNRDEMGQYQRHRRTRMIGALSLLVLIGIGGWIGLSYWRGDKEHFLENLVPWVQSKGRALMGRTSLQSFVAAIERSDLTAEEKKEWNAFIDAQWKLADELDGRVVRHEDVIDLGRRVVESRAGLYYALLWIGDRDPGQTSLTDLQKKTAERLIRETTDALKSGRLASEQLGPCREAIHLAVMEMWPPPDKELSAGRNGRSVGEKGGREPDAHLRRLLRALDRLNAPTKSSGEPPAADMISEFRQEMTRFKEGMEKARVGALER